MDWLLSLSFRESDNENNEDCQNNTSNSNEDSDVSSVDSIILDSYSDENNNLFNKRKINSSNIFTKDDNEINKNTSENINSDKSDEEKISTNNITADIMEKILKISHDIEVNKKKINDIEVVLKKNEKKNKIKRSTSYESFFSNKDYIFHFKNKENNINNSSVLVLNLIILSYIGIKIFSSK